MNAVLMTKVTLAAAVSKLRLLYLTEKQEQMIL